MNAELDWLLKYNYPYVELDSVTSSAILRNGAQEMKCCFGKNDNYEEWRRYAIPVFSGRVCYLENGALLTEDDIKGSRDELINWLGGNLFTVDEKGISVKKIVCHTGLDIQTMHEPERLFTDNFFSNSVKFPDWNAGWGFDRSKADKVKISTIESLELINSIILKPSITICDIWSLQDATKMLGLSRGRVSLAINPNGSLDNVTYGMFSKIMSEYIGSKNSDEDEYFREYRAIERPQTHRIIDENGKLAQKFYKTADFAIDMSEVNSIKFNLKTLENFPKYVYGSLMFNRWYVDASFSGFPKSIFRDVIFNNCYFTDTVEFPKKVKIRGNFIIDAVNPHLMLMSLVNSDITITGTIYSSIYTGSLDHLRKLFEENKWDKIYFKKKK